MSPPAGDGRPDWEEGAPERLYVVTAGRDRPSRRVPLDLVTLVVSQGVPEPGMNPEHLAILRMCAGPLSIAEISAYLSLPCSTVTVLVADLVDGGHVEVRAPVSATARPDVTLLEAVMDGLARI
ncbi:DUF742 domain-containing protein [Spirillospora sp. NPDC029432]|uniref:DUF742 domain-containing protein n=1 Tax=Spirillospora sp. NPDC029432 TaxID=3154599 RepID=UPI0034515887